jgi:hypothetical protein
MRCSASGRQTNSLQGDAVVGHVHAEGVFRETHDMGAALTVETDEALELIGGVADVLGTDGHDVTSQKIRK